MSTLPGSPQILRGALVTLEDNGKVRSTIAFQYNPDTLQRSLKAQSIGGEYGQPLELYGPPVETISFDAEIDATDQLAAGQKLAVDHGIHPTLAALEMLLYPRSAQVTQNNLSAQGGAFILATPVPLTVLVWGPSRVLPVRLDSLAIKEEAFDAWLNPIRATVQLSLRVLNYIDLGQNSQAGAIFLTHQIKKEWLADDYASNVAQSGGSGTLSVTFPNSKGQRNTP